MGGIPPARLCSRGRCEAGELYEVVGKDSVSAPDRGALASVHAAAGPAVAVFEVADAPFCSGSPLDELAEDGPVFVFSSGPSWLACARPVGGIAVVDPDRPAQRIRTDRDQLIHVTVEIRMAGGYHRGAEYREPEPSSS